MNPEEWENQRRFKAIMNRIMEVELRSPICDELIEELHILNEEYSRLLEKEKMIEEMRRRGEIPRLRYRAKGRQLVPYKSL